MDDINIYEYYGYLCATLIATTDCDTSETNYRKAINDLGELQTIR